MVGRTETAPEVVGAQGAGELRQHLAELHLAVERVGAAEGFDLHQQAAAHRAFLGGCHQGDELADLRALGGVDRVDGPVNFLGDRVASAHRKVRGEHLACLALDATVETLGESCHRHHGGHTHRQAEDEEDEGTPLAPRFPP